VPVRLTVEAGLLPGMSRSELARRARAMLAATRSSRCEWSVVLTTDHELRELNREYRGLDRATDVLAFAQREGTPSVSAGRLLGDVVISVPTARRQALANDRDVAGEITMLLAHGLLHLLGWDHDTPARDRRMRGETDRLCAAAMARAPRRDARSRVAVKAGAAPPRGRGRGA
jgi:probable rRNA maturation factor